MSLIKKWRRVRGTAWKFGGRQSEGDRERERERKKKELGGDRAECRQPRRIARRSATIVVCQRRSSLAVHVVDKTTEKHCNDRCGGTVGNLRSCLHRCSAPLFRPVTTGYDCCVSSGVRRRLVCCR